MGIFSRSSDRNGQFSVMFMLLHFLVYFSTVSFHSISVSFTLFLAFSLSLSLFLSSCLDLPMHGVFYCTHSYIFPYISLSIPFHLLRVSFSFSLMLCHHGAGVGASTCSVLLLLQHIYCENTKPSNLINCCHPRPEKVYFK